MPRIQSVKFVVPLTDTADPVPAPGMIKETALATTDNMQLSRAYQFLFNPGIESSEECTDSGPEYLSNESPLERGSG